MNTEVMVINHTKMVIINTAFSDYIRGYQEECLAKPGKATEKTLINAQRITDLNRRIESQITKSFGKFHFRLRDCANIALLVHDLWTSHKRELLKTRGERGRLIRRNMVDVINSFSSGYYDLDPDVEDGMKFRKTLYVDPIDANC